jgi:phenylalanyl-tRNA synthetase beta chain
MIRIEQSSELRKMVEIINPLSEEQKVMRSSTIPSMMETLSRNYARRIPAVRLFELAYEYIPKAVPVTELPDEREIITIGMYGKEDFYSIKGVVEELLFQLGISEYSFEREGHSSFHPGRTAKLIVGGNKIGTIGEIHPEVLDNYDINTRAYVGVIEFYKLLESVKVERLYKQLPKYPVVDRDIAMVVKDTITVGDIEQVINSKGGELLERASLFDVYKGNQIAEGFKSVAYALSFRASDRTLTDEEVNAVMKAIMDELKSKLDAQLR